MPKIIKEAIPKHFITFAESRIGPMAIFWGARADKTPLDLASACYLQGVTDAIEAIDRRSPESMEKFLEALEPKSRIL